MRTAVVGAVCLICLVFTAHAQDIDIGTTLTPSFRDLALLPTRLTAYNQHEDAAIASYTCCKARQEKEVRLAIQANEAFLNRFSDTAFADRTYIHYAWVASFLPDAYRNQEWAARTLIEEHPDSDLCDDAAWILGNLYRSGGEHLSAIDAYEYIVDRWPDSTWADDALDALVAEYTYLERPADALDALNQLARNYRKSALCAKGLDGIARGYMEAEDYESAINASADLIRDFPFNDLADDAQMRIASCLRLTGRRPEAVKAYEELIRRWYGSELTNTAMRESNTLLRQIRGGGGGVDADRYDTTQLNPAKDAQDLWEHATFLQKNGAHSRAVAAFREFIDKFPGNDRWDDSWYEIGMTYLRQDQLFQQINEAQGPDDLDKYREDYNTSTNTEEPISVGAELSALEDARAAFAYIANNLHGSPLQCAALGMVSRCFINYGDIEGEVPQEAAYTYQEMLIHFPFASCRPPWFSDATWPVYSLCRLIGFYADERNWDIAREMYPELSAEFPGVFPVDLQLDRTMFYELMGLYNQKTAHAYYEMSRHIPYGMTPSDLLPEAHFFQAAMLMDEGDFAAAAELLVPVTELRGHGLVAPALYLYAQANARLANWDQARAAFDAIVVDHKNSGLADDAQLAWAQYAQLSQNPQAINIMAEAQKVAEQFDEDPACMDMYVGDNVVVFAPYTRAALMRQYNMPNIWDESQRVLRDWCGLEGTERVAIVVDRDCKSSIGNPFQVPACQIKDPPAWGIGLNQIAANAIGTGMPRLTDRRELVGGLAAFMAASLQYDLVTETRDAIGSASAVKLPQEDVIRARDAALDALREYVIGGEDAPLTTQVVAGMLYSLLDSQGYSKDRLIDREPYRAFFSSLKAMPAETGLGEAFCTAAMAAFGDGCNQQLKDWRLPIAAVTTDEPETRIGMAN